MVETASQGKEIRKWTLALMLVACGISLLVFQGRFQSITLGILIGAMCGLLGYGMIERMCSNIETYENAKGRGYHAYVGRYALYTLVFALSMYKGVNVFALLVGMMCHKAAIVIYAFMHRKEVG